MPKAEEVQKDVIPRHIGFIMDGNRRWARSRGLPVMKGHERGLYTLRKVSQRCFEQGVSFVTFYAFSNENWSRSKDEVSFLMSLVSLAKKKFLSELNAEGVRVLIIGSRANVPARVSKLLDDIEESTKNNTKGTLGLCFNYGGRQELLDMVKSVVDSGKSVADLTPDDLYKFVYQPEIPPCDLIVRTSGEKRLSGFMLARSEYAEFIFDEAMWPEVDEAKVDEYIHEFAMRDRRRGK